MSLSEIIASAEASLTTLLSSPDQMVAVVSVLIAMALMIISSFVKTMIPLRWLGVGGNIGFLVYGILYPSIPVVLFNGILLPINIARAIGMIKLTRRVRAAASEGTNVWLQLYMQRSKRKAGEVLFRRGDTADHLYFLAEGRIEIVEIGVLIEPGTLFGEIAFFAPDKLTADIQRLQKQVDEANGR